MMSGRLLDSKFEINLKKTMAHKDHKAAAARARTSKALRKVNQPNLDDSNDVESSADDDSDIECTSWNGGVNYILSDSEDEDWTKTDSDSDIRNDDSPDDFDLKELNREDLIKSLQIRCQHELDLEELATPTSYKHLLHTKTPKDWKRAESMRSLGYNGLSDHRKWEIAQQMHEKEVKDKVT